MFETTITVWFFLAWVAFTDGSYHTISPTYSTKAECMEHIASYPEEVKMDPNVLTLLDYWKDYCESKEVPTIVKSSAQLVH